MIFGNVYRFMLHGRSFYMPDKFDIVLILCVAGDLIIWLGLYYLSAKSRIRRAEKEGADPDLRGLRIGFIMCWLITHACFVWTGIELVKWGGMD